MSNVAPPSAPVPHSSPPNTSEITELPSPAHIVIKSIQCARCSQIFRSPLRLPCGNSICRSCLPPIHERTGITYPADEGRKHGFLCPWGKTDTCAGEHCLGDCGADVLLNRLVDVFAESLADRQAGWEAGASTVTWKSSRDEPHEMTTKCETIALDLLKGVYGLIKEGRFGYDASDVHYSTDDAAESSSATRRSYTILKDAVRNELDCQVCYSLILDPLTTPCGHTFCRDCVTMVMDHSDLCPVCRRKLNLSSTSRREPSNSRIRTLLETLFPEQLAMRKEATAEEAAAADDVQTLPLFVNSLSFPTMPTFLHVFEPRYRIMMQRVMETRGKKFGMVLHNRGGRAQPGLGRSEFMQFGTVLMVDRYELLPDGRSLIVATGVSRFKVIGSEVVDGYHVGRVQRVEDVPVTEEERLESLETSAAREQTLSGDANPTETPIEVLPTQQLFQIAQDFLDEQRRKGVAWLHPRVLLAYGNAPTDPATFPWWLASVYPLWEDEKYLLLSTSSVRDRLKIVARWVQKARSREWLAGSRPSFSSAL
ncbi:putative ATP-dependent protease (CrgA) [Aspergillus saccharolyticus JOP 1030-1]|uniref:ATP-dependent protease n=1 Tax=Aspergillus saccharolyticus JOP 1030-1 TaxID=1450539 RepID=A0A318ZLC6_9EURO|nr:ATP-dependent protease [Aspergillus saccharolyticus JOP 1030-1]PYH47555.1 ATP-dependent protease [Aspergillus saccharolyticus JOP 1030-1]